MELKVAEGRLSDVILPVAFSDSVPAKMAHMIYFSSLWSTWTEI